MPRKYIVEIVFSNFNVRDVFVSKFIHWGSDTVFEIPEEFSKQVFVCVNENSIKIASLTTDEIREVLNLFDIFKIGVRQIILDNLENETN